MVTVHAYTASQALVDSPDPKEWRRGRAAAANLVPGLDRAPPSRPRAPCLSIEDKFGGDGGARARRVRLDQRDDDADVERATSAEEVNRVLGEEAATERYRDVVGVLERAARELGHRPRPARVDRGRRR